jgi:hypothetical protein
VQTACTLVVFILAEAMPASKRIEIISENLISFIFWKFMLYYLPPALAGGF